MGESIDWSRSLVAVDLRDGTTFRASVDREYAKAAGVPVKLKRNVWTGCNDGGTWYFNDRGLAIGGIGRDGYEGRYQLRNTDG